MWTKLQQSHKVTLAFGNSLIPFCCLLNWPRPPFHFSSNAFFNLWGVNQTFETFENFSSFIFIWKRPYFPPNHTHHHGMKKIQDESWYGRQSINDTDKVRKSKNMIMHKQFFSEFWHFWMKRVFFLLLLRNVIQKNCSFRHFILCMKQQIRLTRMNCIFSSIHIISLNCFR